MAHVKELQIVVVETVRLSFPVNLGVVLIVVRPPLVLDGVVNVPAPRTLAQQLLLYTQLQRNRE